MAISVKPLGAGQEVGRSCVIVKIKDVKIMFDCGVHMAFSDYRKFPDFKRIVDDYKIPNSNLLQNKDNYNNNHNSTINLNEANSSNNKEQYSNIYSNLDDKINYTKHLDLVIITHFHLDHCGALPYFTEICGYNGPIITTQPTKAILPITLEDFRKIISDYKGEKSILRPDQIGKCLNKIQTIEVGEERVINNRIRVSSFYAGHVLGACIFKVEVDGYTVVYTGDYNTSSDRHLGGAYLPKMYPDILITETTYGDTIRDTKRVREREFLQKIQSTIDKGGKVLIPIFALGRAQELCILLDTYWRRIKSEVPIYFAGPMAEKANFYYKIFTNWTNSKIKNIFLDRNVFDFTFVKHGDKSVTKSDNPMVIFATPGMLHGGLSLQIFKEIATDPRNCVIIPGYCTAGTVGNKVLSGERLIEIDKQMIEVKSEIYYMSFSAHADAKGLLQLIKNAQPKNLVLVHGDSEVMKKFQKSVEYSLNIKTEMPPNHEEVFFNLYVFYHKIEMNVNLFRNLHFLLKKNFTRKFENFLTEGSFPNIKVSLMKNKMLRLFYDNPLKKLLNNKNILNENNDINNWDDNIVIDLFKIKNIINKIHLDITNLNDINIQDLFMKFIETYYPGINYLCMEYIIKDKIIKLSITGIKNNKLQIEWKTELNNLEYIRINKGCLMIAKYMENFVKILIEN